jgi:hypothetical protein
MITPPAFNGATVDSFIHSGCTTTQASSVHECITISSSQWLCYIQMIIVDATVMQHERCANQWFKQLMSLSYLVGHTGGLIIRVLGARNLPNRT